MSYMNESLESFMLIGVDDPDPIEEVHNRTTNYKPLRRLRLRNLHV